MFPNEKWNIAIFPPVKGDLFWSGVYSNSDPKEIGISKFQLLRNLVHLRKNELAVRPGFHLLSDASSSLTAASLGLFRHYTDDEDKYSVCLDPKTDDCRLLYKKDDNVIASSAWTVLDADFFDSSTDRVRGIDLKGVLWMSNGVEPMKYFKDETDYGLIGVFKPHLQNSIGSPVFAETDSEKFESCGIFQYRQRFVYDEAGSYSNPGPVTNPYLYQWDWKINGLKSLTLSDLSVGAEFMNSATDDIITKRIISTVIERRFKLYDNDIFGAWSRIDILDGIQSTSFVDSYPDPSVPIVGDYSEPPIAKYLITARDCLIGFNLLGTEIPIPYDQADEDYPKYAKLGLTDRVKIRIKNNTGTTATDAIVTLTDLQWGDSAAALYIDYNDGGANAGKDFQFTDSDGITPLSSFRTAYSAATNTVSFKVRVPEIIGYEEKIIYLYYNGADCGADDNTNWRNVYHRKYLSKEHLALFNMDVDDLDLDLAGSVYSGIRNKAYDGHLLFNGSAALVSSRASGFPFGGVAGQCYNALAETGAITAFATHADGTQVTDVGHGREADDLVELYECTPSTYDGFYHIVTKIDNDNFTINATYTTNGTGSWRTPADGFITIPDTSSYASSDISAIMPDNYIQGSVKLKFKWIGSNPPANQEYLLFESNGLPSGGALLKIYLKETGSFEYIRADVYRTLSNVIGLSVGVDFGEIFNGDWWYVVLSWDEDGAYLRVKSMGGFEGSDSGDEDPWGAVSIVADSDFHLGYSNTLGCQCYVDEFEVTNEAISDDQFDIEFLRETFATAPTITLEEPEDVTEREEFPDGWTFSLPNRPHIFPAENVRYTGFGEGKGIQFFLNSLYLFHKNKIIRGNISSGSQADWNNDYTFADKLTIPGKSITGLAADNGLVIFNMLDNEYQGWVSDGGVKASAGGDPIDISEPINDIFRTMNYNELQHSSLSYSPKYKQLFLGLASQYQTTTAAGAGEPVIKDVRTNTDDRPYCYIQQKTFAINDSGTVFHCVVDWDIGGTGVPLRKLYNKVEAGNWALVVTPDMDITAAVTNESNKGWRSMSMAFNPDRTVLHCVTNALDDDSGYYIIAYNTYTVATDTWGTAVVMMSREEWLGNQDIAVDYNGVYHIVWSQKFMTYNIYYYYNSNIGEFILIGNNPTPANRSCSVQCFNQSNIAVIIFSGGINTLIKLYEDTTELDVAQISGLTKACMTIDSDNKIHIVGVSADNNSLYYCKAEYSENQLQVGELETILSVGTFSDYSITVREIRGVEVPVVFYIIPGDDEIYYQTREGEYWQDAVALSASGTDLKHLVIDQMPLPDHAIGNVMHAGFMDETATNDVKCWQNTTYILEQSAPQTNFYVDKIYCLDLNKETITQNGRIDFVWSEFSAKTSSGRIPLNISCLWDGLDDNRELLFTSSNAAKIFVYGERGESEYYMDEYTAGTNLIIPWSLKTADIKFYNDIFDKIAFKYRDYLGEDSADLRIYLDSLLLVNYDDYPSNEIITLPFHTPVETISIEMSGDTVRGKTSIERMQFSHLTVTRRL